MISFNSILRKRKKSNKSFHIVSEKWEKGLVAVVLLLLASGCQFGFSPHIETPTTDAGPGQTSTAQTAAQLTTHHQAAMHTQAAADALSTQHAEATAVVQSTLYSLSTINQIAENARATSTQAAVNWLFETAEVDRQSTAQARPLQNFIQGLYDEGLLESNEGEIIQLDDFEGSWARINHYNLWSTKLALREISNFVVTADVELESASDSANWFNSGCGFGFGLTGRSFDAVFLAMDGMVKMGRSTYLEIQWLAWRPFTKEFSTPQSHAELVLVVQGINIYAYVDGVQVLRQPDRLLKPGILFYSIMSGTNKSFGTRCKISDSWVWVQE